MKRTGAGTVSHSLKTPTYTKHFFSPEMTKLLKKSNHALIGALLLTQLTPVMLQNLQGRCWVQIQTFYWTHHIPRLGLNATLDPNSITPFGCGSPQHFGKQELKCVTFDKSFFTALLQPVPAGQLPQHPSHRTWYPPTRPWKPGQRETSGPRNAWKKKLGTVALKLFYL